MLIWCVRPWGDPSQNLLFIAKFERPSARCSITSSLNWEQERWDLSSFERNSWSCFCITVAFIISLYCSVHLVYLFIQHIVSYLLVLTCVLIVFTTSNMLINISMLQALEAINPLLKECLMRYNATVVSYNSTIWYADEATFQTSRRRSSSHGTQN